jgi:hypothetical protein
MKKRLYKQSWSNYRGRQWYVFVFVILSDGLHCVHEADDKPDIPAEVRADDVALPSVPIEAPTEVEEPEPARVEGSSEPLKKSEGKDTNDAEGRAERKEERVAMAA